MGIVFALLGLNAVAFFLTGYVVAVVRMTKHLRAANDLNKRLNEQLAAVTEDPADWWKGRKEHEPE